MKSLQFVQMEQLMQNALPDSGGTALVSGDGQCLWLKTDWALDGTTLPHAAHIAHTFFNLKKGDLVLLNDPYSGGTWLSDLTFVTAFKVGTEDVLLARRIRLKPRRAAEKIDLEGVRIPPTPLMHNDELNLEVLKAIRNHPSADPNLEVLVLAEIEKIQKLAAHIGWVLANSGIIPNKKWIKDFNSMAHDNFARKLKEVSFGESTVEWPLEDGGRVRLRLEVKDDHVVFDFTGTTNATQLALTDSLTLSACVGTLAHEMKIPQPWITGMIQNFALQAPQGSIVHAKYPAPAVFGCTEGANLLSVLVLKALSQIDKQFVQGMNGVSSCPIEIEFHKTLKFFDQTPAGLGAHSGRKGIHGSSIIRTFQYYDSIEQIEKNYPLMVRTLSYRQGSGGHGRYLGGMGITKQFEVLEPCTLRWKWLAQTLKSEGAEGGKTSIPAELQIMRAGQSERENLPTSGEIKLSAHDQIILHSAGGGGFGAVETSS